MAGYTYTRGPSLPTAVSCLAFCYDSHSRPGDILKSPLFASLHLSHEASTTDTTIGQTSTQRDYAQEPFYTHPSSTSPADQAKLSLTTLPLGFLKGRPSPGLGLRLRTRSCSPTYDPLTHNVRQRRYTLTPVFGPGELHVTAAGTTIIGSRDSTITEEASISSLRRGQSHEKASGPGLRVMSSPQGALRCG
jgi:hypothetical protein